MIIELLGHQALNQVPRFLISFQSSRISKIINTIQPPGTVNTLLIIFFKKSNEEQSNLPLSGQVKDAIK
jgi:hypothetical protein